MLDFLRRHQRYFFLVITVVIVISFSFFGTYSTLSNTSFREQVAFTNLKGRDVTKHEVDEVAIFLSTDAHDKIYFGGTWGPNFLNDGVIKKDFLQSGLGVQLARAYPEEVQSDLVARVEKEKRYKLYVNPSAKFIGVEGVWNNFSPHMANYYYALKSAQDPLSEQALQARVALYILERQFPPGLVRQVLRYQEKQNKLVTADPALDNIDLSLFGYHTTEDWFGPRFVRLIAEFIMNAAIIAEQRGYQVTKDEALADLMRNSEQSYTQNVSNPNIGVANSHEYFNEQLRRMGMDQNMAAKVWRQVMLFRKMFNDMGSSVFVDPLTAQQFNGFAGESVEGDLYRLPKALHLSNYRALQKLEVYLDAVAKRTDEDRTNLTLPTTYLSVVDVESKTPELVEKRYLVDMASIDKSALQAGIGVKELWSWQASDKGWTALKKKFPELKLQDGARDERFAVLDALDEQSRRKVDAYAKDALVEERPELLTAALDGVAVQRKVLGLHSKGAIKEIPGLEKGQELIALLDSASMGSVAAKNYTPDGKTYYRITVIDRAPKADILNFADADATGALDKLLDAKLEAHYLKIRDARAEEFQNSDKKWKPLAQIKEAVADNYFEKVLKGIRQSEAKYLKSPAQEKMLGDYAAHLRFLKHVSEAKSQIQKDPSSKEVVKALDGKKEVKESGYEGDKLASKSDLQSQWTLEKAPYQTVRSNANQILDLNGVLALAPNTFTAVNTPSSGDVNFFFLERKGTAVSQAAVEKSVGQVKALLGDEAKRGFMRQVLDTIKAKNAISLQYLNVSPQE